MKAGSIRHAFVVLQDGLVGVWSTETGRELLTLRPQGGAQWVQMLSRPGGAALAVVDGLGRAGLWRAEPFDLYFPDGGGASAPVNGQVAVNQGYGEPLRFWDLAGGYARRSRPMAFITAQDPKTVESDRPLWL